MTKHPLNISYLVMGVVFLGIAASWGLRETGLVDVGELEWLLPLTLVLAGVVGLAGAALSSRGSRTRDDDTLEGDLTP